MAISDVLTSNNLAADRHEAVTEQQYEAWKHWPVNWTAVWVGALSGLVAALIFGLIGIAIGAYLLGPEHRVVDWHKFGLWTLAFSIFSSFLAFAIAGWVTGKVAGILRSEPAMLHGAIAWLVAVPLVAALAVLGANNYFGGWYSGLARASDTPTAAPIERPVPPGPYATPEEIAQYRADMLSYRDKLAQWQEETPKAVRASALGALTALLLGLMGSVIGGWMASGEPMTLSHHFTRTTSRPSPSYH